MWLTALPLLLLLSAATLTSSSMRAMSTGAGHVHQLAPRTGPHVTRSSSSSALPTYPQGDCATQCSVDSAARMASCQADPATGIPATQCMPVSDGEDPDFACPTVRYPDAFHPEAYCLPRFAADCAHPDNYGCSKRCILYVIVTQHCVTDAYDTATHTFNAACTACNMCYDRSGESRAAARAAPYVLLWARGPMGALFKNHWLVLPKQACSGIESSTPGCTDKHGEFLWSNAYHEAQQLGFSYSGGEPTWTLWLNAPNRRGQHQMHIHIAHFGGGEHAPADVPPARFLVRRVAAAAGVSTDLTSPTRVLGEGAYDAAEFARTPLRRPPRDWARAYVVFVASDDPARDLGAAIRVFALARQLSAASDLPSHSYGIFVMPRRQAVTSSAAAAGATATAAVDGLLLGIAWSTTDSEQLDEGELPGDPIRYSHTCQQYAANAPAAAPAGSTSTGPPPPAVRDTAAAASGLGGRGPAGERGNGSPRSPLGAAR